MTRFWAIADTHLSFGKPKDMSKFGEKWQGHPDRLAEAWRACIGPDDVVLIPGDISWAQNMSKFWPDLNWLAALPGRKILLRGNHDHWWKHVGDVRKIIEPMGFYALEGDSLVLDGVIICGGMGYIAPEDPYFEGDKRKDRFARELSRLERALEHAAAQRTPGQRLIIMTHYPPFTSEGKRTAFVDLIATYKPTVCLYGHLHREREWEVARNGDYEGVSYKLVAADYVSMTPELVMSID